jgi:acyl-CoA reductase-like NAD-dependent aldehyde dehydrogenase
VSDRLVDAIFFTGSNATGLKIAELAAKSLMKVQLELGGKDGVYVHHDVHIDSAAEGLADGALFNNGQSCK